MNVHDPLAASGGRQTWEREADPSGSSLHGSWMLLLRTVWIAGALLAVVLFSAGIPQRVDEIRRHFDGLLGVRPAEDSDGTTVLIPQTGGQAARAGILTGDELVAVDGVPPGERSGRALQRELAAGALGTPVTLSVRTGSRPSRDYQLVRGGAELGWLAPLGLTAATIAAVNIAVDVLCAVVVGAVAVLIFRRRRDSAPALLASLALVVVFIGLASPVIGLYMTAPAWTRVLDTWFGQDTRLWRRILDVWFGLAMGAFLLFCSIFPDGRWVPRWTRGMMALWLVWMLAAIAVPALYPWYMPSHAFATVQLGWFVLGGYAQVARYRWTTNATVRRQTRWVVFGAVVAALGLLMESGFLAWRQGVGWTGSSSLGDVLHDLAIYPLSLLLRVVLPVSIGAAILRYHLWDIDLLVNRTLVYALLTAGVVGVYVLIVGGLGALFAGYPLGAAPAQGNLLIALVATGVVAVLFQPLRERLQRSVNRLMYGERDDPYAAIARLGRRLEASLVPASVLPAIVETVAQTLKIPFAAVSLGDEQHEPGSAADVVAAASYGTWPSGTPFGQRLTLLLTYQGATAGRLILAPRGPDEPYSAADMRLLQDLARQAGVAAHAVLLTADLERSRLRIVAEREEARRRLGADLHDGLGHRLAGLLRKAEAAANLVERDPAAARSHLHDLTQHAKAAITEVRSLAHTLHPPELELLGLAGALHERADALASAGGVQILVELPETLPPLPAALEVAIYYIALEALTNVQRHAGAHRCLVRLAVVPRSLADTSQAAVLGTPVLELEVGDDGNGVAAGDGRGVGLGLQSMRERAAELGGTCVVEPNPGGGTRVITRMPLLDLATEQT